MLAGGAHNNQTILWYVGRSTMFDVLKETVRSMNYVVKTPGVPIEDEDELERITPEFCFLVIVMKSIIWGYWSIRRNCSSNPKANE